MVEVLSSISSYKLHGKKKLKKKNMIKRMIEQSEMFNGNRRTLFLREIAQQTPITRNISLCMYRMFVSIPETARKGETKKKYDTTDDRTGRDFYAGPYVVRVTRGIARDHQFNWTLYRGIISHSAKSRLHGAWRSGLENVCKNRWAGPGMRGKSADLTIITFTVGRARSIVMDKPSFRARDFTRIYDFPPRLL